MFNLFDVTRSIEAPLSNKPRQANDAEVSAYAQWLRQRRGLPDMGRTELHFTENRQGRRYERGHCIGATFGDYTSNANRREYEPGAYSIIMPGHDMHRAAVTFEALDEAGEVERTQTLPAEPKKGGVIWTREDVRSAHGPVEKARKARASKAPIPVETPPIPVHAEAVAVDPVEICQMEAAGSDSGPCAVVERAEAPSALCEAVSAPDEPSSDPVAALLARVEVIEAQLAALSVETGRAPIPAVQDRPKRSAAHERAIRRAWAERRARRLAMAIADDHMRMREHLQAVAVSAETCAKSAEAREARAIAELADAKRAIESQREVAAAFEAAWRTEQGKRRTSTQRARRMIAAARHAATFERQRAAVLAAQLAKAQEDLATAYSETELQAAVAVERERAASLRADLEAARAEGEGRAVGAGVAAAQAAAQMARAIAAEEAVAAVRADLDKERAALAAVTARNARLLQSMADLTERVERAEAAIAA